MADKSLPPLDFNEIIHFGFFAFPESLPFIDSCRYFIIAPFPAVHLIHDCADRYGIAAARVVKLAERLLPKLFDTDGVDALARKVPRKLCLSKLHSARK